MKPNCYECKYRRPIPGDAHSQCAHPEPVRAVGAMHGIMHGWWMWPDNFDPVWLESCDGFERRFTKELRAEPEESAEAPICAGIEIGSSLAAAIEDAKPFTGGGGAFGGAGASGSWGDSSSADSGSSGGDSGGGGGGSE